MSSLVDSVSDVSLNAKELVTNLQSKITQEKESSFVTEVLHRTSLLAWPQPGWRDHTQDTWLPPFLMREYWTGRCVQTKPWFLPIFTGSVPKPSTPQWPQDCHWMILTMEIPWTQEAPTLDPCPGTILLVKLGKLAQKFSLDKIAMRLVLNTCPKFSKTNFFSPRPLDPGPRQTAELSPGRILAMTSSPKFGSTSDIGSEVGDVENQDPNFRL